MTCDPIIELLPWYLNGTLEPGEHAEVRQHLVTCESCRAALAETGQAWALFAQHILAPDMVALAWGERPSGIDPAAAEEHLASCAECAAELELARMSRRLEEEHIVAVFPVARPPMAPGRADRGWRAAAIAASLAGLIAAGGWFQTARQSGQAAIPPAVPPPGRQAPVPQPQVPVATVDGELAALRQKVKELGDYSESLKSQVRKTQEQVAHLTAEPALSPYISPTDVVRGQEDSADIAVVPARASLALLPLRATHPETGAHENHEVVILSKNGSPLKTKPIRRDPNGSYLLALTQGELKPGDYTLQVYGTKGGKRDPEPDGTYRVRIQ
ncbi:MAG TPA: zf-HC2 domain-containing protein [Thermoanaerobaculia bacterium]|nr:zf-HC2 domain-containing protein [Thermoanaerobaculia bacterium]